MRNFVAALTMAVPAMAFAGGYVVPNVNARDLAMAGSATAAQDSAGATYQNPSALSRLDGINISADLSIIDLRSTWRDSFGLFNAGSVTSTPKAAFPPAVYAAYGQALPNEMRFGVGAGLTIPGGGYVFWPGDWVGNSQIITVDRKVYGMYLTGGLQVLRQLRVGGGLVYYRTTEHLIQGVDFPDQRGQIELGTSGGAVTYDVSAEVTPLDTLPLTLAVDYKQQGVQHLSGQAHGTNIPATFRPNLLDQNVTHTLIYPNQLNVGAAFRPLEPLVITADWTWERFVVYQSDLFTGDRGATVVVPRNYKNGYTFRLGGEYAFQPRGIRARAGILRDISPNRAETASPTLPDANVTAITFGLGYAITPNLEVNGAFFHAFYDSLTTTTTNAFPGTFDTRTNIYALNITYRMGLTQR